MLNDNICVKGGRSSREFFQIAFHDLKDHTIPVVTLSRYIVPGRCDLYWFAFGRRTDGSSLNIEFSSERGWKSLPQALEMLHKDLENPAVVEFIRGICSKRHLWPHTRELSEFLLDQIAPKATATKVARRIIRGFMAEIQARMERDRAARMAEEKTKPTRQHARKQKAL